ncbi:MAG: hypothetical protein ACREVG_13205, partial [Burkholderiales bacterium]
ATLLAAPAAAQEVRDALDARDLICEFRNPFQRDLIADLRDELPPANLMLVYESVTASSAHVISSGRAGRRPVQIRAVGDALHFIERDGPSVRVTTLTECKDWKWKDGVETCVRFGARHAWHFDVVGTLGPDLERVRVPGGASVGVCEAWNAE